jgi:hypothetical protein
VKTGEGGQPKWIPTPRVSPQMLPQQLEPPQKLKMPKLEKRSEKLDMRLDTSQNRMLSLKKSRRDMPDEGQLVKQMKSEHERRQKRNGKRRREFAELRERSKERGKQMKCEQQMQERLSAANYDVHERSRVWMMTSGIGRNPIGADPMIKQKRDIPQTSTLPITIATVLIGPVMKVSSLAVGDPPLYHQPMAVTQPATDAHLGATLTCHIPSW